MKKIETKDQKTSINTYTSESHSSFQRFFIISYEGIY